MIKVIQMMYEMAGNGTSYLESLAPVISCLKMPSVSISPTVIVIVLSIERAGCEKGDRCMCMCTDFNSSIFIAIQCCQPK